MNVKNVEKENGAAKVTIEIARDEFQTALDKAYAKIRKDIMIPGFRKGKAPRKFVERMYGSQVFYEDAVNEIFPEIYEAAIVKQELKAVGQPSVTDMQTPEDGSVVLTVSTELYPEVTLGEYKGIEVPKETVSISKAEVDAELGRMQDRNARIETVDREAKTGDTVVLDFEGFVDGKPFDGGKAEGHSLELGSGSFVPGFEEQIVGMNIGDEKDIDITFPENYAPELPRELHQGAGRQGRDLPVQDPRGQGDHQARARRRVRQGRLRIRHAGRPQEEHQGRPRQEASGSC